MKESTKPGKESQSKKLVSILRENGYKVAIESFPRYDKPMGKRIKKGLFEGEGMSQLQFAKLYEIDRFQAQPWIQSLITQGYDFLVLDRYTMSNMVFQQAKGVSDIDILEMQNGLIHADLHIIVDISVEESISRGKAYAKVDKYERDTELLSKVRDLQLSYAATGDYYGTGLVRLVNGEQERDLVTAEVYKTVKEVFNI